MRIPYSRVEEDVPGGREFADTAILRVMGLLITSKISLFLLDDQR